MQLEQLCVQYWRRALPDARLVCGRGQTNNVIDDRPRPKRTPTPPVQQQASGHCSLLSSALYNLNSLFALPCPALPSLSSASDSEHSCCALLTKEYLEAAPLLAVAARTRPRQAGLFLAFPAVPHIYSSIQHRLLFRFIIDSQTSPTCT